MQSFGRQILLALVIWVTTSLGLSAQSVVPEFRFVFSRDVDFFGADLDPLFDTDLDSCVRACSANRQCAAFTFNSRSNACFPKRQISEKTLYEGALSGRKVATKAGVLQQAAARKKALNSLGDEDLSRAGTQMRDLGLRYPAGGYELEEVLETLGARRASGNINQAVRWAGTAVSMTDRSDLWLEYARLLLRIRSDDRSAVRRYEARATSAAINAYLRGDSVGERSNALVTLSLALDRAGRGRDTIPVLRLASELQPRADIQAALEKVIAKYGFRITDSAVESDSAAPRICAQFSEPLVQAGVDYGTYVRLPDPSLVVQVEETQLCVDGVEHGNRYRLTLRQGLPADSGEKLIKDVELTHYVRDRNPSVRFPGRSYVLPKSADAALPIETVNVTEVDLRLRRLSDRNLLRAVQDGFFGRPLSQWQDETFASEIAEEIWTGKADVSSTLNRDVKTRLPMAAVIKDRPAGIYALTARVPGADPYDDPGATQWFVLSDLGISTLSGSDGLHVTVLGLVDAEPRTGVELTLISRANAVLARGVTDAQGYARFEPGLTRGTGAAAPALVLAEMDQTDIGFLSLTDPAFDLSDRGVEGRASSGPVDVFVATDRGAYRAGETIQVTALSRNSKAAAIEGLPLIAVLRRPDGVEHRRLVSNGGVAGGHVFSLPIGLTAPRGTWRLDIKNDPEAPALVSKAILVEDFLPERIDFDLNLPNSLLREGDTVPLGIQARYLFGAPGSDLTVEGQATLRASNNLAGWPGYRFGRYDEQPEAVSNYFGGERTDARGQATVLLEIPETDVPGQPMEVTVTARLADGSARPVERQITASVQTGLPVIGIKPLFDDVVGEGGEASFDVTGLGPDLTPIPMQVKWTLNRVQTRYQWYQLYGNWNWEPTTQRTRIASGKAELNGPVSLSQAVEWGRYELVIERLDGEYASAATDFFAGWYAPADSSAAPDRLEMSLDKETYSVGETARLRIVPRMAGTAMVSVMSSHLIERMEVRVDAGETIIPLTVSEEWGTGAYVSATVIQPMDLTSGQNPARALGIAHAAIDPGNKALSVSIDVPDVAEPRQSQKVRLAVTGAIEGEDVWLTLAAVDLGILNLTGFQSPDPKGHFFGQQRLGMELRDVYGRLIDGMNGAIGTVRSGGDNSAGMRMQSPPPTQKLMASFSGPVKIGQGGQAFVNVDIPAFNGTVRLMAIAWSDRAVGQAETDMLVRDPVVVTASVPDFLAPGDSSRIRLEAVHADGPAGEMELALSGENSAIILGPAPGKFVLGVGGKAVFDVPVSAQLVGDPEIAVHLTTPDGRVLTQMFTLPVRSNDPVVAQTRRFSLGAGDSFAFTKDVFAGLRAGTGKAVLSAGPLAKFDAPGLLMALDRYPYGCTEQVTSQAMPLLYLSSVAKAVGLGDGPDVRERVNTSISRILSRQASNGAFGLWRAETGDFWLDAYASDFLSRARLAGFTVPDRAFRLAMDNLRNRINYAPDFDKGGEDIAYALMVLAREGAAAMGDLRYYADVKGKAFGTSLAAAQLGAALTFYGDQTRADAMFSQAGNMLSGPPENEMIWRTDYGTRLRDVAGLLALTTEAGSDAVDAVSLGNRITRANVRMSTQEAAWSLLAAQALIKSPEQSGLMVNGAPVTGPFVQVLENGPPAQGMTITASGGRATDITLTTLGVPNVPPEQGGTGYAIERSYYTIEGTQIEPRPMVVGERFVIVLRVTPFEKSQARLMIDDPLPAGVQIDNPSLLRSGDVRALDWLKPSVADHAEFRSDRFLAAVDLRESGPVTLAYIARAVTPGNFHHPAASVEDMYRPRFRARTETGRMVISE